MACPDTNCTDPCTTPCNQYDNCGCVNPTTFGCTSYSGVALPCLGVANGENGDDILAKIEAKTCNIGKVLLNTDDTCPEYLADKITAGLNVSISYTGTGCDRTMVISATEGGVPVDVNVKVSSDDTTSGYLDDKIQTGTYLTKTIKTPDELRVKILSKIDNPRSSFSHIGKLSDIFKTRIDNEITNLSPISFNLLL